MFLIAGPRFARGRTGGRADERAGDLASLGAGGRASGQAGGGARIARGGRASGGQTSGRANLNSLVILSLYVFYV